jgi:hypothetical protein
MSAFPLMFSGLAFLAVCQDLVHSWHVRVQAAGSEVFAVVAVTHMFPYTPSVASLSCNMTALWSGLRGELYSSYRVCHSVCGTADNLSC